VAGRPGDLEIQWLDTEPIFVEVKDLFLSPTKLPRDYLAGSLENVMDRRTDISSVL